MDWKLFFTTFFTIFLAEMGDKTQLAAMAASSQSKTLWEVFLAVIVALVLAGSIGVFAGRAFAHLLTPQLLKYGASFAFILMGLWILFRN